MPSCGRNAHCEYGLPNRCICNTGYSGNPYESCTSQQEKATCESTQCGLHAQCRQGSRRVDCVCPIGFRGNPYIECSDVDECIGNACGMNAVCLNTVGSYDCRCEAGFNGNPFQMCMPLIQATEPCLENPESCGCETNTECPSGFNCQNGKCQLPCAKTECGPNADCDNGVCLCLPGTSGNPNELTNGCQASDCNNNLDCDYDEICIQSRIGQRTCVDACERSQCGPNAFCVAQEHRASCLCQDGFVGNPSDTRNGCQKKERENWCSKNTDCDGGRVCQIDFSGIRKCTDPCLNRACGRNEKCTVQSGRPICSCLPGFVKNPQTSTCQGESLQLSKIHKDIYMYIYLNYIAVKYSVYYFP